MRILLLLLLFALPAWAEMPYAAAGLNDKQAAAHLLSRFSYGARPGQIDEVARMGVDKWFRQQLEANQPDPEVTERLAPYKALTMTADEIAQTYMNPNMILQMAVKEGLVDSKADAKNRRKELIKMAAARGLRNARELAGELVAQKIVRSVYANNQLQEVMTDFWFNHFNVSLTDNQARNHVLAYERDAIRPNSLGKFLGLLEATAKHPAMLLYLDNAQSMAPANTTTMAQLPNPMRRKMDEKKMGLNENFARELMELHTLGVDGGYTQKDVEQVARILTGWTTFPQGPRGQRFKEQLGKAQERGVPVVVDGQFVFVPYLHDAGPKNVLGRQFPAGRGVEEGMEVLEMLSKHPSTAKFLSRKLAARFVSDQPDPKLVDRLAKKFLSSNGDTKQMLLCLVESPEFWASESRRAKVKSPMEYVASSIRALGGDVRPTRQLYDWLEKMGQPVYRYQAPTGFPDRADTWINSGTLVNRINFAFALVGHKIPGVTWKAPEKLNAEQVARQLLTGRDWQTTLGEARKNLKNPKFFEQVQDHDGLSADEKLVGILVSSPEFQRR